MRQIIAITITVLGTLWFAVASMIAAERPIVCAIGFILLAIAAYFLFAYVIEDKNVLSLRGLFSAAWMGTIGLSCLKLLGYQVIWETETWVILGGAFFSFQCGFLLIDRIGISPLERLHDQHIYFDGRITARLCPDRLYWICVVTTLIGVACFISNIVIRGYIPFFVTDELMAYYDFYTRFNIFTVASTAGAGLCYYTLRTQPLSLYKKIFLICAILYEVVIMPVLAVSRGTQMIAILMLTVPVVMLSKRKLPVFFLCLVVAFGLYEVGTYARHLSNEYLEYVFQPKDIMVASPAEQDIQPAEPSEIVEITVAPGIQISDPIEETVTESSLEAPNTADDQTLPAQPAISLPPRAAFLYGYLTVSHDNFNEAVAHRTGYSLGLRQLQAFTAILRFPRLKQAIENLEFYQVSEALNTGDLITDAYYDFGALGCCVFIFLWACIFAIIEQYTHRYCGPFSMITLGVVLVPVILCFFESWLSYFTFWLLWGTNSLMFFAAVIRKRGK